MNPGLYTANLIGTFGNAGHLSLRGPGYFDVDLAVSRQFSLRERLSLQVRVEGFNVLNHPNFGLPNGNIASANFGQITSASRSSHHASLDETGLLTCALPGPEVSVL